MYGYMCVCGSCGYISVWVVLWESGHLKKNHASVLIKSPAGGLGGGSPPGREKNQGFQKWFQMQSAKEGEISSKN